LGTISKTEVTHAQSYTPDLVPKDHNCYHVTDISPSWTVRSQYAYWMQVFFCALV
jgi:hypothetical protein